MVPGLSGAIIAAGRGERLRAASGGVPKPLVELDGQPLLVRQAHALANLGAVPVYAIINSETAAMIRDRGIAMPHDLRIRVRDTANSMESLFALGERLEPGLFLLATVDAVVPRAELARFVEESRRKLESNDDQRFDAMLAVTRWRGDRKPLFADITKDGLITRLGGGETFLVTAGIYLLPASIFALVNDARRLGLDALRRFLAMLIERGVRLGAIEIEGAIDVDEASDLAAARTAIRSQS